MASEIEWSLLGQPGGFAEAVRSGYDEGVRLRERRQLHDALATYSSNPADARARQTIYTLNPQLGAALEDQAFQRDDRQRAAHFRSAFSGYLLGGEGSPAAPMPAQGAFAPPVALAPDGQAPAPGAAIPVPSGPVAGAQPAFAAVAPPSLSSPGGISPPVAMPPQAPRPRIISSRDEEWQRMVESDPASALGARHTIDQMHDEHVKLASTINAQAIQLLAGVHDQASYDQAKARARDLYGQAGVDFDSLHLPDAYSPDAIDQLTQSALATKDRLAAIRAQRKLDWDIQDDTIDNTREERNTESLIGYRGAEIGLGRERNTLTRRGQDLNDTRGRYIHDTPGARPAAPPTPTTVIGGILAKRAGGQPLTSAEQSTLNDYYLGRGGRGRGRGRAAGTGGGLPDGSTATGPGGHKIVMRGGQWVDPQTGRPIG